MAHEFLFFLQPPKIKVRWYKRPFRRRHSAPGFTLLELLVVLAILGLIAAFAVPRVMNYLGGAKTDAAKIQIENISTALDLYRLDVGRYPTADQGLEALVSRPADSDRWNGPYVKKLDRLLDPWRKTFVYRFPGEHAAFDLYSLGADGVEGGDGENRDLTSW